LAIKVVFLKHIAIGNTGLPATQDIGLT